MLPPESPPDPASRRRRAGRGIHRARGGGSRSRRRFRRRSPFPHPPAPPRLWKLPPAPPPPPPTSHRAGIRVAGTEVFAPAPAFHRRSTRHRGVAPLPIVRSWVATIASGRAPITRTGARRGHGGPRHHAQIGERSTGGEHEAAGAGRRVDRAGEHQRRRRHRRQTHAIAARPAVAEVDVDIEREGVVEPRIDRAAVPGGSIAVPLAGREAAASQHHDEQPTEPQPYDDTSELGLKTGRELGLPAPAPSRGNARSKRNSSRDVCGATCGSRHRRRVDPECLQRVGRTHRFS